MYNKQLLEGTRVIKHWAGRNSRGVTQYDGTALEDIVFAFDKDHFVVTADVDISDQFFGWLLGFGKCVKLLGPQPVVEKFAAYMDKIREMY